MNKKEVFVKDVRIDQKVYNEPFSLRELEVKASRAGKTYYNIKLGDKTGEIRGKVWTENMSNVDSNLSIGDIVYVTGQIQEFNSNVQIIADSIRLAKDFPADEFLETTKRDRSNMASDLDDAFNNISNPYLKELALTVWNGELKDRMMNYPAGEYVHHGYVGGFLEHIWEMWQLAKSYINIYEKLDKDLVLVGILVHDIGKMEELEITGTSIERTFEGKLIAHLSMGLIYVEKLISKIENFPEILRAKVLHIIISHNGSVEFGSPVKIQTLEAYVVWLVDKSSADMNMATGQITKDLGISGLFSGYNKWLGTSMYQGDYLDKD